MNEEQEYQGTAQYDPSLVHNLGVIGSGMLMTTALLYGLQSFGRYGPLFGRVGQALADPVTAAREFLGRGREILSGGEETAGDAVRKALIDKAADDTNARRLKRFSHHLTQTESLTRSATHDLLKLEQVRMVEEMKNRATRRERAAKRIYQQSLDRKAGETGRKLIREALDNPMSQLWYQATAGGFTGAKSPLKMKGREVLEALDVELTGSFSTDAHRFPFDVGLSGADAGLAARARKNAERLSRQLPLETQKRLGRRPLGDQLRFLERTLGLDLDVPLGSTLHRGGFERSRQFAMRGHTRPALRKLFGAAMNESARRLGVETPAAVIDALKRQPEVLMPGLSGFAGDIPDRVAAAFQRAVGGGATENVDEALLRAWDAYVRDHPHRDLGPIDDLKLLRRRVQTDPAFARLFDRALTARNPAAVNPLLHFTPRLEPLAANDLFSGGSLVGGDVKLALSEKYHALLSPDSVDTLAEEVGRRLNGIQAAVVEARPDLDVKLDLQKVSVDGPFKAYQVRLRQKLGEKVIEKEVALPIMGPGMSYQRDRSGRLLAPGIVETRDPYLSAYVGRTAIRADELVMIDILEQSEKMRRDLIDGRGVTQTARHLNDIYSLRFEKKTLEDGAPFDLLAKGALVRFGDVQQLGALGRNRTRAQQMMRDLDQVRRLQNVVEGGSSLFAFDIEFQSEAIAKGRGSQHIQAARGELPYQISAALIEEGETAYTVDYKARLFEDTLGADARKRLFTNVHRYGEKDFAPKNFYERTLRDIYQFQRPHMGKGGVEDLFRSMHTGEITIRAGQESFRFAGGSLQGASRRLGYLSGMKQEAGESMERFFLRMTQAISAHERPTFAAGHNVTTADRPIMESVFARHGLDLPDVLARGRELDTYQAARALTLERGASNSLTNLISRLGGVSPEEFEQALRAAQGAGRAPRSEAGQTMMRRLQRVMTGQVGSKRGAVHSADLDALLSGRLGVELLGEHLKNPHTQLRLRRTMQGLRAAGEDAGLVQFVSDQYGHLFGFDEDNAELNYAMVSQEEAALGSGSALRASMLPFHRLSNPARQRYQDIKYRMLLGQKAPMSTGAFRPIVGMEQWFGAATGTSLIESKIHSGFSAHTKRFLGVAGAGADNLARTSLVAFVPETVEEVFESSALVSSAHARSTHMPRKTGEVHFDVDYEELKARSKRRAGEIATRFEVGLADQTLFQDRFKIYEEIAMLEEMERFSGEAGTMATRRAIEARMLRLRGDEKAYVAFQKAPFEALKQEDSSQIWRPRGSVAGGGETLTSRMELFRRDPFDPLVKTNVRIPYVPNAAPIDVVFGEDGRMTLRYITDPGLRSKQIFDATKAAKVTTQVVNPWTGVQQTSEEVLPGSGVQALVGAMFTKDKRKEYGSMVSVQIQRAQRRANEALAVARARYGLADVGYQRAKRRIEADFTQALADLTGMSTHHIKREVLAYTQAGGEERLTLQFDEAFMRKAEGTTTLRMMKMSKTMGLTYEQVYKSAVAQIKHAHAGGFMSETTADRLLADVPETMRRAIEDIRKGFQESLGQGVDPSTGRKLTHTERAEVQNTIERLRGAERNVSESREGALFDMLTLTNRAEDDMQNTPAFLAEISSGVIQQPGGSKKPLEQLFAAGTGRITKQKRMSMLDSALLGRVFEERGSSALGILARGWLNSTAGIAQVQDNHFSQAIFDELERLVDQGSVTLEAGETIADLAHQVEAAGAGRVVLRRGAQEIALRVAPFNLASSMARRQGALEAMITGRLPAKSVAGLELTRVETIDFAKADGPVGSLLSGLRETDRAKAHLWATEGVASDAPEVLKTAIDRSGIYLGEGPGMMRYASENPLLRRDRDFVRLKLHEAPDGLTHKVAAARMRTAGLFETQIKLLLGDENALEKSLLGTFSGVEAGDVSDLDPAARRLRTTLGMLRRQSGEAGIRGSVFLPTIEPYWQDAGGFKKASLPAEMRHMIDTVEKLQDVGGSISRVMQMAIENPEGYRSEIDRLLKDPETNQALQELRNLEGHAIKSWSLMVLRDQETSMGRYIEGQYKLSASPLTLQHKLQRLEKLAGDEAAFRREVEGMIRTEKGLVGGKLTGELQKMATDAHNSLFSYVKGQSEAFGADIYKWKGFGVGEGLASHKLAERVRQKSASILDLMTHKKFAFSDELREGLAREFGGTDYLSIHAVQSEVVRLGRAIAEPGSESVQLLSMRQPIFQNVMPMHVTQGTVLHEHGLFALGADPNQVHVFSNPVVSWMDNEDFDGDIRYVGLINQPALSAALREQYAGQTGHQMRALYEMLGDGAFDFDEVGGRVVTRPRQAAHQLENADVFARAFAYGQQALSGRGSVTAEREALALQKAVVGRFGKFQKRSVLRAQSHSIFGETVRQMSDHPDLFSAGEIGRASRILSEIDALSAQPSAIGGVFETLAAAEAFITQEGAIEKHKGGDAVRGSTRALDMLSGFYAERGERGAREAFDMVFSAEALRGESLAKHYWRAAGVEVRADYTDQEAERLLSGTKSKRLRRMLQAAHDEADLLRKMQDRLATPDAYLQDYTDARLPSQALGAAGFRDITGQGVDMAGEAIGVARNVDLAASLMDRLRAEAHLEMASSAPGWSSKLMNPSRSAKLAIAAAGALGLVAAARQDNVTERTGSPYTRHTTRRMLEARSRSMRELHYAGSYSSSVRYGFAVPAPETRRASY